MNTRSADHDGYVALENDLDLKRQQMYLRFVFPGLIVKLKLISIAVLNKDMAVIS